MALDGMEISFDDNYEAITDEEFVCELSNGLTLPLGGTDDQMTELRTLLNNGTLISARSSVGVDSADTFEAITEDGSTISMQAVTLQPGPINLIGRGRGDDKEERSRRLAYYEGSKKTLVVRVTDIDGRSVAEDAAYISDKFFGTSGDTMTMKSGFDACSFGRFAVSENYEGQVDATRLSAPGVVDVSINVQLTRSTQATIVQASLQAVEQKLGLSLPSPFDHVVLVVEECYRVGTDCAFAAYAYVNHWLSLFKGDNFKYPAVQMHEIGECKPLSKSMGSNV